MRQMENSYPIRPVAALGRAVHSRIRRQDLRGRLPRRARRCRRTTSTGAGLVTAGRRWASAIVLVHGSRPQVAEQLELRNVEGRFHNGVRVTDTAALECAKEAAGELRLDIEAAFSQGLPNTPMSQRPDQHRLGQLRRRPPAWRDRRRRLRTHRRHPQDRRRKNPPDPADRRQPGAALAAGFLAHRRNLQPDAGRRRRIGCHRAARRQADLHHRNADDCRRGRHRDPRTVVAHGRSRAAGGLPVRLGRVLHAACDQGLQRRRRSRPHHSVRDGRLGAARGLHARWRGHHDQPREPRKPASGHN